MSNILVLLIDSLPLSLKSVHELSDLLGWHHVLLSFLFLSLIHMQILDHFVLTFNIMFYSLEILGCFSEIFFLGPECFFLDNLRSTEDILDGIGDNKVFITFKSKNWFLISFWYRFSSGISLVDEFFKCILFWQFI